MPRVGQPSDHEIERVVVWLFRRGEEKRGVTEVPKLDGLGNQKIGFVDGAQQHLGLNLSQLVDGNAFFQPAEKVPREIASCFLKLSGFE
uniref:Uncharacterized protein n=1 Tax=Noccaea caerulescens TaxID=107243 RepID=A0A1J3FKE3_NOCCA